MLDPRDLAPIPDVAYRRFRAQIHNDARGWDAPENLLAAESEPSDPDEIWGNWTHEELSDHAYELVVPVSMGVMPDGKILFTGTINSNEDWLFLYDNASLVSLDGLQNLERVGSSMDKVLKCNVYLNDLKDYAAMNEVFLGRFGPEPPVRTTIAAPGGIPGNSLVEIDVIATM